MDLILTTTDTKLLAEKIAKELLIENLCACVQIDNVQSFYKWQDKLQDRDEYRLIIKAKHGNYKMIESKILSLHNDITPQIIKIDVTDGLPSYLNWVNNS